MHAQRDLPVHHGPVPVLPPEPAALAELHPSQSLVQRLLREGASLARAAGQGQLLDTTPRLGQHVRERLLPPPTEALQVHPQGGAATGAEGDHDGHEGQRR